MRIAQQRIVALIGAGAIAFAISSAPVMTSASMAEGNSAMSTNDVQRTPNPSPPIYSAFHGHGTIA
ncbi:hypothetical protein [Mycobacterium sp. OTB74]|uniref:hypothetical protein n=1 Tax=Mycobacterium sp. OTB74 TaxID=1853452 RepID=UPI002473A787|nr:hypothetical protein [Mycobacterium sp. OTB74]MDH6247191.1 hypothetical protein [Mycobacterium sp. OTB74]